MFYLLVIENEEEKSKLAKFYELYHRDMFVQAYDILKDTNGASDAVQDAFIRVSKNLYKIDSIKCNKTRAYLVIIVRNVAIDEYRSRQKNIPVDDISLNCLVNDKVDINVFTDETFIDFTKADEFANKLKNLSKPYSDVLMLYFYYEFSTEKIAQLLNISENNVKVRLTRAKSSYRKLLESGEENV